MNSQSRRLHSFKAAWMGLAEVVKKETNFRIELIIGLVAVILGWLAVLSQEQWLVLLTVIFGVLILEMINSAFERLADLQKPRLDPLVRIAKDISAAAVLLASFGAIIIGLILFGPWIWHFLVY